MDTRGVVEAWLAAYQRRDAAAVANLVATTATFHVAGLPDSRGRDACLLAVTGLWAGFPDLRSETAGLIVEGHRAAWRWHYTGTHTGALFGLAATGLRVDWPAATFVEVTGDSLAELWFYGDVENLVRQLGGPTGRLR